jgi:mRNA interferase YafQ
MKVVTRIGQFKKDYKRAIKARKNINKLREVVPLLANGKKLLHKYKDHKLAGIYSYARECHIEPDWLLIYEVSIKELKLIRLGSHTELFD